MIIYLYGPDSYRRQEKLNWYLEQFKAKHSGLSVEKFDLSAEASAEADLARFRDFVAAQSLFAKTKLGIVKNVSATDPKGTSPVLKSILDDKSITLIISEDKKLPKDFAFLAKAHTVMEFTQPAGVELEAFVRKSADERNLKISPAVTRDIIRANDANIWGIINDLNKLELGGKLDEHLPEQNFWSLINKAKEGDLAAVTWLLENEEPAMIFNIMAAQADPFLKTKMADYDAAIKSGKLDYEEALLAATLGD